MKTFYKKPAFAVVAVAMFIASFAGVVAAEWDPDKPHFYCVVSYERYNTVLISNRYLVDEETWYDFDFLDSFKQYIHSRVKKTLFKTPDLEECYFFENRKLASKSWLEHKSLFIRAERHIKTQYGLGKWDWEKEVANR